VPERPPLKSVTLLKEIMGRYYAGAEEAKASGRPVVWMTAVSPVEIVVAMGLFPYYPENFGTLVASKKLTHEYSHEAEAAGFFPDLCGYARAGLGDWLREEHPAGRLVPPDVVVCCNAQCHSLPKWFEVSARWHSAPYFLLDTPLITEETQKEAVDYFHEQLLELIRFLEAATGRRFSLNRLVETMDLANRACRLWKEILEMAALRPAPFSFFDACIHMGPIVTWRGTELAVEYYRRLKAELEECVARGEYPVPEEKYKLYWDHIVIWPRIRWLSEFFARHQALVACSQYTHAWAREFDLARPLESLAETYALEFVNRSFKERLELKAALMRRFRVDGFILFSNRSCKPCSLGLYDKRRLLMERAGIPGIVLETDMADLRYFNETQVAERLEMLFEQLEGGQRT
jgi:benzoyl-CoA reductase/2-hydroxyglutaryl-CoA dehydratase subunit BcrC/BadD/HgdB